MASWKDKQTAEREHQLIETFLTSWKLYDCFEPTVFKDNGIDLELFLDLNLDSISSIFPNTLLGPKLKLLKRLKELKEMNFYNQLAATTSSNFVIEYNPPSVIIMDGNTEFSASNSEVNMIVNAEFTGSSEDQTRALDLDIGYVPSENELQNTTENKHETLVNLQNKKKRDQTNLPETEGDAKKAKLVNTTVFKPQQAMLSSFSKEVNDLDLLEFLNSSLDGKCIILSYKRHNYLEEDDENLLADLLAKWILLRNTLPKQTDFLALKEKIAEEFPNTADIFYIPPKSGGEHQRVARGKLYDRVRNVKDWMRRKCLLERCKQKKEKVHTEENKYSIAHAEDLTQDVLTALEWLWDMTTPWEKVQEKWEVSSKYRLATLKCNRQAKTERQNKLKKYTDEYKVLKLPSGYTLIEIDFTTKFGMEKTDALTQKWPTFRNKIISMLRKHTKLIKDSVGLKISELILASEDTDEINVLILQLLPSLVPNTRLVKYGRKSVKPSIRESRESIVCRVHNASEVTNFMKEKREKTCKLYGQEASVQPYILIVGHSEENAEMSLTSMERSYVCVDNFSYAFDNILQAVDVCFKAFFALDMAYPALGYEVWLLIQRFIYGITTGDDINILKVTRFIQILNLSEKK